MGDQAVPLGDQCTHDRRGTVAPKPGQLDWTPAQARATSPGMLLKLPGPQEVKTAQHAPQKDC